MAKTNDLRKIITTTVNANMTMELNINGNALLCA